MNDLSQLAQFAKEKTRVLVYSSCSSSAKLFISVLKFNGKNFDFFSENDFITSPENDFVILETSNPEKASAFQPNIAFIAHEIPIGKIVPILPDIISGGVLIFSENIENEIENTENYFRKIPFSKTRFQRNGNSCILDTEIGIIPLMTYDEDLIENINGIKFLSQQFGIMEENFYEAAMTFE